MTATIPTNGKRLDPSQITPEEESMLARLLEIVSHEERAAIVGRDGKPVPLPDQAFHFLSKVIRAMNERKTLLILPDDETFTTQAASAYLGMSRQYFVTLLEAGKIPFHKVGTHRRVKLRDLLEYERGRDAERKAALNTLSDKIDAAGLYDAGYTGDADAR